MKTVGELAGHICWVLLFVEENFTLHWKNKLPLDGMVLAVFEGNYKIN
jgi:hypothetical protein